MHVLISCNAFTQHWTELYVNVSQFVGNFNEIFLEDRFIVLMSELTFVYSKPEPPMICS